MIRYVEDQECQTGATHVGYNAELWWTGMYWVKRSAHSNQFLYLSYNAIYTLQTLMSVPLTMEAVIKTVTVTILLALTTAPVTLGSYWMKMAMGATVSPAQATKPNLVPIVMYRYLNIIVCLE